jgi:hypothetical protein
LKLFEKKFICQAYKAIFIFEVQLLKGKYRECRSALALQGLYRFSKFSSIPNFLNINGCIFSNHHFLLSFVSFLNNEKSALVCFVHKNNLTQPILLCPNMSLLIFDSTLTKLIIKTFTKFYSTELKYFCKFSKKF